MPRLLRSRKLNKPKKSSKRRKNLPKLKMLSITTSIRRRTTMSCGKHAKKIFQDLARSIPKV